MSRTTSLVIAWIGALAFALGRACLPQTTLPEPGSLEMHVKPSDETLHGFTAFGGWDVHITRALIALGRVRFEGTDTTYCHLYPNDEGYLRILDVMRPESQKLALLYTYGHCDLSFALDRGDLNAVTGQGVTTEERTLMASAGSDTYIQNKSVSFYLEGNATNQSATKTFAWAFRERAKFSGCGFDSNGEDNGISLSSGVATNIDVVVHAEAVFQRSPFGTEYTFNRFAQADDVHGNADGEITIDELFQTPLPNFYEFPDYAGGDAAAHTLGDYVYKALVARVPRFADTGHCAIELNF